MSESTQTTASTLKVIRAAFAAALADREDLPIGLFVKETEQPELTPQFLSLVNFSVMGYPFGDELLPLMEQFNEEQQEKPPVADGEPLTTDLDILIDDARAGVHDKFFNISPAVGPQISFTKEQPILNRVYERFLRTSEFAGKLGADTEELEHAQQLLFPLNEEGVPVPSQVYRLYEEYADKCLDQELKIAEAKSSGQSNIEKMLTNQLQRIQAEWLTLGRKKEVEAALHILNSADAMASFEDERVQFIERLNLRLRERLSSAFNYAAVSIRPLKPLLEPESSESWQLIELTAEDVVDLLTPDVCALFNIEKQELAYLVNNLESASLQYLPVILSREWLSSEFLSAGYWRNKDGVLSDGQGGGEAPTVVNRMFFIKSGTMTLTQGLEVVEKGTVETSRDKKKAIQTYQTIRTPLIQAVIEKQKESKEATKLKINTISKLKNVQKLHQINQKKLKKVKSLKLAPGLSRARLKPITIRRAMIKPRLHAVSVQPKPTVISRLRGIRLTPQLVATGNQNKNLKQITVTGTIDHNHFISKEDLKLSIRTLDNKDIELSSQSVSLTPSGKTFKFSCNINNIAKDKRVATYSELVLTDKNNNLLLAKTLEFKSAKQKYSLHWSVEQSILPLGLCDNVMPTLFAYELELLPKAPNPDHSLFND